MDVNEGNRQVIDIEVILENFLVYYSVALVVHNLLVVVYSTIQYSTIVVIVYENKCHRTKERYDIIGLATMLHFLRFTPRP